MMDEEEKKRRLHVLEKINPFISSSVGDPRARSYPHVEAINKRSYDGLCRLIGQKAINPDLSAAGLVTGEVGEGKTHLLGRILEFCRNENNAYAFAYIQPIEDPEQPYRYLLREITANLFQSIHARSRVTFIEKLTAKIFAECIDAVLCNSASPDRKKIRERLKKDPLVLITEPQLSQSRMMAQLEPVAAAMLRGSMPRLAENFIPVLLKCRNRHTRQPAMRWLKGNLVDTDDQKLLGISGSFNFSLQASEQHARDLIESFGEIMARYGESAVICFDRLENLDQPQQVHALGKMVEFLVDSVKGMLPVACFREIAWEDRFKNQLNQHVVTRLETNRFYLQGCLPEQAVELVRSRLKTLFGDNELFPFEESNLLETFKAGGIQSPRRFITQANVILNSILGMAPQAVSVYDQIKAEYDRQFESAMADIDRLEPDRSRLRRALLLYFESLPPSAPFRIENLKNLVQKDKYVDFMCRIVYSEGKSADALFIIDTEEHHLSVSAALKRGVDFFEKFPDGKAIYIRDLRSPFPEGSKWPETNKIRIQFEAMGGSFLFFDKQQVAAWYALALLSYSIKEGDIAITDAYHTIRPATWNEFLSVASQILHKDGHQAFKIFDDELLYEKKGEGADGLTLRAQDIAGKCVELLRASGGMMMLTTDRLAEDLKAGGFDVKRDQVLSAVSCFRDRFEIVPSKDRVIVLLKKDWLYAQR
ncbi:MAG: hypothetical protein R6U27_04300 [Desulfobacterales bacterium]